METGIYVVATYQNITKSKHSGTNRLFSRASHVNLTVQCLIFPLKKSEICIMAVYRGFRMIPLDLTAVMDVGKAHANAWHFLDT